VNFQKQKLNECDVSLVIFGIQKIENDRCLVFFSFSSSLFSGSKTKRDRGMQRFIVLNIFDRLGVN
jgi:hypothetical protein